MKVKKIVAVLLALGLLFLVGCSKKENGSTGSNTASNDTKPVKIKITTVQLDKQQMGKAAARIKELAEQKLGDKVQVEIYPGAQLYSGVEELEAIKKGDIQMTLAIGSAMSSLDPAMGIFKLPFLFPNTEVAYQVLDGPVGEEVFKNVNAQGVKVLGGFSSGNIIVSNNKRPIKNPADFKGLKMRSSGKAEAAILEAMGAVSVVLPSEETYAGLQQGIADGMATPSTVFYARKYHEVQKYVTNAGMLYWSNGFILVNDKFWQGLPEDTRKGLEEVVDQVLAEVRAEDQAGFEEMLKKVEESGVQVHNLTPEEAQAWKEAAKSVYDKNKDTIGAELVDKVTKTVDELTKK